MFERFFVLDIMKIFVRGDGTTNIPRRFFLIHFPCNPTSLEVSVLDKMKCWCSITHRRQTFKRSLRIVFAVRFKISRCKVFLEFLGMFWDVSGSSGIMSRIFNMDSKMNICGFPRSPLDSLLSFFGSLSMASKHKIRDERSHVARLSHAAARS